MTDFRRNLNRKAIELSKQYDRLFLEWATKTGKTLVALNIMEELGGNWVIFCYRKAHIDAWNKEIKKHNKENLLLKIEFMCYKSAHKLTKKSNFTFDEAHHVTQSFLKNIKPFTNKHTLCLSATMPPEKKVLLNQYLGPFHYYKSSLKELSNNSIINDPKIIIHYINLDETNRVFRYKKHIKKDTPDNRILYVTAKTYKSYPEYYKGAPIIISCTSKEYLELLESDIKNYRNNFLANKKKEYLYYRWMQATIFRKRFIASLKTGIAINMIKPFINNNERFVLFGSEINQIEEIASKLVLKDCLMHSNMKNPILTLDAFNNKKINALLTVDMLKESANLNDLDNALMIQLFRDRKSNLQILGRTLRGEYPKLNILVIKNTIDEKYFKLLKKDPDLETKYFIENDTEIQLNVEGVTVR